MPKSRPADRRSPLRQLVLELDFRPEDLGPAEVSPGRAPAAPLVAS